MRETISIKNDHGVQDAAGWRILGIDLKAKRQRMLIPLIFLLLVPALLLMFLPYINTSEAASKIRISEGEEWHYYKGTKKLPKKWHRKGFDDSGWEKGRLGLGYGHGRSRTYLRDMRGKYKLIYARREFVVKNPLAVKKMTLSVFCDGPFKAYLNGIGVINYTIVQAPSGSSNSANMKPEPLDLTGVAHELIRGKNVLAIECSNDDIDSDDFSFSPSFEIIQE